MGVLEYGRWRSHIPTHDGTAPAGGELAASSDDGTVHLWDTDPATAEAAICANLGQPLTREEWAAYIPDVAYRAPCS